MHPSLFPPSLLQSDPKRFKKPLPKILKTMKPEDRVMIVGVTKQPFGTRVAHTTGRDCLYIQTYICTYVHCKHRTP